jgi:hypothetical protein
MAKCKSVVHPEAKENDGQGSITLLGAFKRRSAGRDRLHALHESLNTTLNEPKALYAASTAFDVLYESAESSKLHATPMRRAMVECVG